MRSPFIVASILCAMTAVAAQDLREVERATFAQVANTTGQQPTRQSLEATFSKRSASSRLTVARIPSSDPTPTRCIGLSPVRKTPARIIWRSS
jgi:hypothetical protein